METVDGDNMTTNYEAECRRICDRLSEIDDQLVTIEQQVRGRIEISGVYMRFHGWGEALEYLQEALAARISSNYEVPCPAPDIQHKGTKKRSDEVELIEARSQALLKRALATSMRTYSSCAVDSAAYSRLHFHSLLPELGPSAVSSKDVVAVHRDFEGWQKILYPRWTVLLLHEPLHRQRRPALSKHQEPVRFQKLVFSQITFLATFLVWAVGATATVFR